MLAAKPTARRGDRVSSLLAPFVLLLLALLALPKPAAAQDQQDAGLFRDELEVVRLINLERRAAGLLPLAWNAELTTAARDFARDAVENQADYCGHVDSQGRSAATRMRDAGYSHLDVAAENALCGYLDPAAAVKGWMKSAPHRANILNADLREVGIGYYRNAAGSGYAVLDLAADHDYGPLVIDNDAATTSDPQVQIYLYDQDAGDDWQGVGPTLSVMIANTPDFAGASWEPYAAERNWTLVPGEGWRTVYVKTRDRLGRTTIVHDSIYLGSAIPDDQLSLAYATQVESGFTLNSLDAAGYSHIQFSLNWLADDSDENFARMSGNGERVNDAAAVGGNAYHLAGGGALAMNWGSSPLGKGAGVAYFRLKVGDNSGAREAAVLTVNDGVTDVAVRRLAANAFAASGQYQEFAVPFTPSAGGNGLVVLWVKRSGAADLYWDTATLYAPPQAAVAPLTFAAPAGYYRSSGIQARLVTPGGSSDGTDTVFSAPVEVYPHLNKLAGAPVPADSPLQVNPSELFFTAPTAGEVLSATVALACPACGDDPAWVLVSDAAWLSAAVQGGAPGSLHVQVDPSGLESGVYTGTITLSVLGRDDIPPITLSVTLLIGQLDVLLPDKLYIPVVLRR